MVIADRCAIEGNKIWETHPDQSGFILLLGAIFFTFQIYGDFSGYSDIAIGTARLFGINLMHNFNFPYFSRDIAEFWRKWHISLTTWFRDYIYIPLGGSRGGKWMKFRNTMIIFLVSGFWHGANWTFVVWGAYHALLFLPLMLMGSNRKNTNVVAEGKLLPSIRETVQMLITFGLVLIGWIIFRANSLNEAYGYVCTMFTPSVFDLKSITQYNVNILFIITFIIVEWIQRDKQHVLQLPYLSIFKYRTVRIVLYLALICFIYSYQGSQGDFIYFQF